MSAAFRYKAFLSYSHKDHKDATWLHSALENYRLPKHLRNAVGEVGVEAGGRLGRIFRDRDELPAADDLTAEVKKALQSSEFMIVLCSPRAAASRWVNKEVIEFKKLRGEAAVFPIILEGEPNASASGNAVNECFPPGVRFRLGVDGSLSRKLAEPIAADLRKSGDGRQHALLKLIAGLLGIGLDQLIEREMQRKQRRVIAVTAASVMGTLLMGALTYEAVIARREAEYNRAQAEDLVEFMLTDLREKLEPVGRLDVLDAVGAKAVAYYDAQALDTMPDASLGRRARAFHVLGEVQNTRNNMDAAKAMFDRAGVATGRLMERDSSNANRIFDHSQSVFWSAYQDWQQGNYESAYREFQEYKRLALRLVEVDPANLDWQMELAYANSNLGTLLLQQLGEPQKALLSFRASLEVLERMLEAKPDDVGLKLEAADKYAWVADAYNRFGPVEQVLQNRRSQQEILGQILKVDSKHAQAQFALMVSLMAEARVLVSMPDRDTAADVLEQAEQIGASLIMRDSSNMNWLGFYGSALYLQAEWALIAGDLSEAVLKLEKAKLAVTAITDSSPLSMIHKIEFYYYAAYLGARHTYQTSPELADAVIARLDDMITAIEDEREAIVATRRGQHTLMAFYGFKAEVLQKLGRDAQAKNTVRAAFQQLDLNYENMDPALLILTQQMASAAADTTLAATLGNRLQERGL